jgi:hypothetical protein
VRACVGERVCVCVCFGRCERGVSNDARAPDARTSTRACRNTHQSNGRRAATSAAQNQGQRASIGGEAHQPRWLTVRQSRRQSAQDGPRQQQPEHQPRAAAPVGCCCRCCHCRSPHCCCRCCCRLPEGWAGPARCLRVESLGCKKMATAAQSQRHPSGTVSHTDQTQRRPSHSPASPVAARTPGTSMCWVLLPLPLAILLSYSGWPEGLVVKP